jgi:hypothetical protein
MTSIDDIGKKKRGRPPTDATPVLVRLMPAQISPLDAWIAAQPDPKPSRPEAIRYALTDWLTGRGYVRHCKDPEGMS